MSIWSMFSNKSEEFASLGAEILDRPRGGYYPIEKEKETTTEKVVAQKVIKEVPKITFEEIQSNIKEELVKVGEKIDNINAEDLKIQKLKQELESFKSDNKNIYDKIEALKSVGLVNTPSSKKLLEELRIRETFINDKIYEIRIQIQKLENIQEATKKYELQYPSFKFIDTETFTNILKKYNLVLGDSALYCKEIPDNVLTNIVKFKNQINAGKKHMHLIKRRTSHRSSIRLEESYFVATSDKEYYNRNDEHNHPYITHYDTSVYSYCKTNLVIAAPINHFKNETINVEKRDKSGFRDNITLNLFTVDNNTREFIIDEKALNNIAQSNNKIARQMDDPIACLRVEEGFIIIDAWEKEALIPELNRESLN